MGNEEIHAIVRPYSINTVKTTRSELERAIQQSDVSQHCFYCNFTLECGQQTCLWHEDID